MEKRLIGRGLLAGAIGAVLAFVFARLCAEPVIARAIEFEDGRTDAENAHGVHEHGAELFTRGVQANPGLGFGVLIFGIAMGALFAVVFCVVYARTAGRTESPAPHQLSLLLAAGAFVAVYLVPFLKYPPNPPAVGQSDTIAARTGWYLLMVLVSVLLAIAAVWLAGRLADRFGVWNGRLLAAGAYLVALVVVTELLPTVDETPGPLRDASGAIIYPGFPADVLYEFRVLSLGTQLLLWVSIGLVFATLAGRLLGERAERGRVSSIAV
ncbi:cobalt transporter [Mycobacterium florentinum]|uniref:Cobalt transporter n=1 Tax=Mycobacterium florentinum TaxID=292462 RepID=A0A1X1U2P1_MYCFL|nr:CbtA family protein [Mycobacterium florentinum]MCV7410907.1 CbtA family protein [Mycobacterium florentinum]ORV51110.1 cobalt transporter [Mycobacterium florentinum]BBX80246.1 cobalt transporter [Mycobacterium florentinum]